MKLNHRIGKAVKTEFGDSRLWWSRAIVVAAASAAGLTVAGFFWLSDLVRSLFCQMCALPVGAAVVHAARCGRGPRRHAAHRARRSNTPATT